MKKKYCKPLFYYKLARPPPKFWDMIYDAAVVVAHSAEEAKYIHPQSLQVGEWWLHDKYKISKKGRKKSQDQDEEWAHPTKVTATLLGAVPATSEYKAGMVVLASYNA